MPRQADRRPLVVKRYKDVDLAHGMSVTGGVDGDILVIARYRQFCERKHFPMDTPLVDRLHWQHTTIERLRLRGVRKVQDTTLREDIDTYLSSLTGKRRDDAEQWLSYWRDWYGHLKRSELTLGHCQAFFQHISPKSNPDASFSGSSKNHLRTYLIAVWRYFDGRKHECPVNDIPLFEETKQVAREIDPAEVEAILSSMGDTPSRACLGLLYVTGCRPAELKTLRPDSFRLDATIPYVAIQGAKDGKDRMVPLPERGVQYARDFIRHQVFGRVPRSLCHDMVTAARRAGLVVHEGGRHPGGRRKLRISPYTLRHTYAMNMRRSGAGIDDIADALGHRSLQTTRRYAQAIPERQVKVTQRMWESLGVR